MGVRDTGGNFPSVQFDFLRVHFVDIPGDPEMNRKKKTKKGNLISCVRFFFFETELSTGSAAA